MGYALNPAAPFVLLANRVEAEMGYDWVTKSIFITELREALDENLNTALDRAKLEGLLTEDSRAVKGRRRAGFVLNREHQAARWLLGDFAQPALAFSWDDLSPNSRELASNVIRKLGEMTSWQKDREIPAKTLAEALAQADPGRDWNQALKLAKRVGVVEERKAPSSRGEWMARLFRLDSDHPTVQEMIPKVSEPSPTRGSVEKKGPTTKEGAEVEKQPPDELSAGLSKRTLAISGSAKRRFRFPGLKRS